MSNEGKIDSVESPNNDDEGVLQQTLNRSQRVTRLQSTSGTTAVSSHSQLQAVDMESHGADQHRADLKDFSPSASSWEPSDQSDSDDLYEIKSEKAKQHKQFCGKKRLNKYFRKSKYVREESQELNSNIKRPSIEKEGGEPQLKMKTNTEVFTYNQTVSKCQDIMNTFRNIFSLMDKIDSNCNENNDIYAENRVINPTYESAETQMDVPESDNSSIEDLDRSDDNILITNKYDSQHTNRQADCVMTMDPPLKTSTSHIRSQSFPRVDKNEFPTENDLIIEPNKEKKIKEKNINVNRIKADNNSNRGNESEWIPIGSGTTLIHRDKFKQVNWKTYTVATRSLLMAAFSRRTLATHTLSGKPSPAFKTKPVKMSLDERIVMDIIIEIKSRFNVRESYIRSVITTKCADESKMYKTRMKKRSRNQENVSPDMDRQFKTY